MSKIDSILHKYPYIQRDHLIPLLQEIQSEIGYLNEEAIVKVAEFLKLPTSKVYGLATFYNDFHFDHHGKYHIVVCSGTSCHLNKSYLVFRELKQRLGISEGEVTKDKLFSYAAMDCMAACGSGPIVAVNGEFYTQVDQNKIKEIIENYRSLEEKQIEI